MEILIVTRGRDEKMQVTANQLREAEIPYRYILTKGDDPNVCHIKPPVIIKAKGISEKRQKILEKFDKFLMLDDDLRFLKTCEDSGGNIKPRFCTHSELRKLFLKIETLLKSNAMVGVEQRFMIHTKQRPLNKKLGRFLHVFGVNKKFLTGDEGFFRVRFHSDQEFTIRTLWNNCPAAMISSYCHSDAGQFFRPGGCSIYRTIEMDRKEALRLQTLWPELVTIREGKAGEARVRVSWAKIRKHREQYHTN